MFTVCWLLAVVAGAGAGLVSASPPRPAQPVGAVGDGGDDERGEQVLELVAGQRDEAQRWWVAGVLGGCGHHQERGRQQGQGHLAVPGAPAAGPGADPGRTAPCRPALLEVPGLIDHQHRARVAEVLDHQGAHVVADPVVVPDRPGQQVLHAVRVAWPACSAIVQQFLRGRSASSPSTNALARRLGSTLGNQPATRPITSSNNSCHRAGSTSRLWPAATV
jgi:hypothetical protein